MADTKKGSRRADISQPQNTTSANQEVHSTASWARTSPELYGNRGAGMQPQPAQTGALNPSITEYKT
jgi:hypothetical protein